MTDFELAEKYMIFKAIGGSKAYGTDTETSDTDIRGIFLLPNEYRLGNKYFEQASDETNDITYYELNRFIELLRLNNPNIIELLFTPEDKILLFDDKIKPLYDIREQFLTKQVKNSFGGYALSQIRKARGLKKKIVNPIDKVRKSPLDFCFIIDKDNGYMIDAKKWLSKKGYLQEKIGLAELPNGIQTYKVYYDHYTLGFRGIIADDSNTVRHSEIPKNYPMLAFLYFNLNGYSSYCKEYNEYWEWVGKRNPHRYNDNIKNDNGYDCYLESETEFLTENGWKKFDDINNDKLATINENKEIIYQEYYDKFDDLYSGKIYKYENRYSKFSVTPNHKLLVSDMHRSIKNNFSTKYNNGTFYLEKTIDFINGDKYQKHILSSTNNFNEDYNIDNDTIKILGAFLSNRVVAAGFSISSFSKKSNVSILRLTALLRSFDVPGCSAYIMPDSILPLLFLLLKPTQAGCVKFTEPINV